MTKNNKILLVLVLLVLAIIIYGVSKKKQIPLTVVPDQTGETLGDTVTVGKEYCYFQETKGKETSDYLFTSIVYDSKDTVHGVMNWLPGEKDSLVGEYTGTVTTNTKDADFPKKITILYTSTGEGMVATQEEMFIVGKTGLKQGIGEKYEDMNGMYRFKNGESVIYENFVPAVDCGKVAQRFKTNYLNPNPKALSTKYIKVQNETWPPEVRTINEGFTCKDGTGIGYGTHTTTKKTFGSHEYCITTSSEGAAGSTYTNYTYRTPTSSGSKEISFTLRFIECMNYDEPEQKACKAERIEFNVDSLADKILYPTGIN